MLTSFTVDAVLGLFRRLVESNGTLWIDWLYNSKSQDFVNNRTYKYIYDYFKNLDVDMSAYSVPVDTELPIVDIDLVDGKKTKFTTADITRLVYAIPRFSKWKPSEILPYTSGFNFMDYRGTYIGLYQLGADLSEYVHPDIVMVIRSGGKVEKLPTYKVSSMWNGSANWDYIGSVFALLIGVLVLLKILKK